MGELPSQPMVSPSAWLWDRLVPALDRNAVGDAPTRWGSAQPVPIDGAPHLAVPQAGALRKHARLIAFGLDQNIRGMMRKRMSFEVSKASTQRLEPMDNRGAEIRHV